MADEIPKGKGRRRMLTEEERDNFHNFVVDTREYFEEH